MRFSPRFFAAEDVHVEVHDGLTGVDALVGDDAETVLQTLGLGDLLDGVGHGAHGLGGHVIGDVTVVLLGGSRACGPAPGGLRSSNAMTWSSS